MVHCLQVITRIPAAYRAKISTVEFYLRLLDTHALYFHLEDFRYSSPLEALVTRLQAPLRAVVNILRWITVLSDLLSTV